MSANNTMKKRSAALRVPYIPFIVLPQVKTAMVILSLRKIKYMARNMRPA
jgi:hypothetical protein